MTDSTRTDTTGNDLLRETLAQMFGAAESSIPVDETGFNDRLWSELTEAGFSRIGVPEAIGGSGGEISDAYETLYAAGKFSASIPIAENLVAGLIAARAGVPLPTGSITIATATADLAVTGDDTARSISGTARRVPWAAVSDYVLLSLPVPGGALIAIVATDGLVISGGVNVAGEARDDIAFDRIVLRPELCGMIEDDAALLQLAASARAIQTAGAIARMLEITTEYVNVREQFGRTLSAFQVVKQLVAELAGESAAARVAAQAAFVLSDGRPTMLQVASAKIRTARSASRAAPIAHQLHGAIGFTNEHKLHRYTTRVWSWRDEFGAQGWWEEELGAMVLAAGADRLWPSITEDAPLVGAR